MITAADVVTLACPSCGHSFAVPEAELPPDGTRARCRSCGAASTLRSRALVPEGALEIGPESVAVPAIEPDGLPSIPLAGAAPAPGAPPPLPARSLGAPPVPAGLAVGAETWSLRTAAGEQAGLEMQQVKGMIRSGHLVADDGVLPPGELTWRRAGDVPSLQKWLALKAGSTPGHASAGPAAGAAPAAPAADDGAADPRIKAAVTAGGVAAGLTAIASFFMGPSALVDAAVLGGLSFGVSRKSRACAVLLLVFYVAGKVYMIAQTGAPRGIIVSFLFAWYFWQGVAGTFAWHSERSRT